MTNKNFNMLNMTDKEIAQQFYEYVERMEDKERHSLAACKEVEEFDLLCSEELGSRLHTKMYNKMMDCAVEYEESGFIAGFRTAMALSFSQEAYLPKPTQIPTYKAEKRLHTAFPVPKADPIKN